MFITFAIKYWASSDLEIKQVAPDLRSQVRACWNPLNDSLSITERMNVKSVCESGRACI